MTKKEYILKLLTALEGKRVLARGLRILVEWNALNDTTIDWLVTIFAQAIDEVADAESKELLDKGKTYLQKLKAIEESQHEKDEKWLQELDKMLDNF